MPDFSIDNVRIHYDLWPGPGQHIVLVHAYATNSKMWEPQIKPLAARRSVVAYDVRGFGQSSAPDDAGAYSQDRSIDDLLALLDHLKLETADICGLSMGGNIALNFALKYPERVSSLVVSGTGSGSGDPAPFVEQTSNWARIAERDGMKAFADHLMTEAVFSGYASRGPRERAHLSSLIMANTAPGVAHTAREVLAKRPPIPQLVPRMRRMKVRSLLIAGELDEPVAFATKVMADAIPDARLEVISGGGHFNNLEFPERLNRLLGEFLGA